MISFSKRRCRCSGLGDITDVLMTILDTYSESFVAESGLCLSSFESFGQGVLSLQDRFDGVAASIDLVCLMIAENADDEPFWSRSSPNRGTMTLVGDAVMPHGVVCGLFKDDSNGALDFTDSDVVCCSI